MVRYEFPNTIKGDSGSVLVIGGCSMYTGAPYFAALSALRSGADIVYIFTEDSAMTPLKVLLPEAIVCTITCQEWILKRVNSCVIGPGLGRPCEDTVSEIKKIIKYLSARDVPLIIDGDALQYISEFDLCKIKKVIYTPNLKEEKLIETLYKDQYVLNKGETDIIYSANLKLKLSESVCQKRCGGQGDMITGILAVFLIKVEGELDEEAVLNSIYLTCKVIRSVGYLTYKVFGISTITRDLIDTLPRVMNKISEGYDVSDTSIFK